LQGHGQAFNRCTSAFLRIVLHVDRAAPETARYDLCCTRRLASKHALIAEKAEGHHAHLASILNGVHRRNRRRNGQHKSDYRRADSVGPTWMHSFTRAFLSTGHVKSPILLPRNPVEHPDRLGCRLQQDHAALSFEIGFSIR
jgi:hypothetical protein